ncbi:acid phosphatase type 7-like [Littorina saxatilis]|uniref:Purple acid phosphatase n=1 Tax=Littorina saxatilis TaxID=31220 RepID=A0AAN9C0G7_9CAEN
MLFRLRSVWIVFLAVTMVTTESTNGNSTTAPEQIHVTLGDDYSQMQVLWAARNNVTSWVAYGEAGGPLGELQQGGQVVYLSKQNWRARRFIYRAVLQNLTEGVKYSYRVHNKDSGGEESVSALYNFTTLTADQTHPKSFVVYGDLGILGGKETFPALQEEIQTHNHTAVWHVGDFAYDLFNDGGWIGDEFLRKIEPVAANIPYMVSPGNHEIELGDFIQYRTRFSIPGAAWPIPAGKMWYSYDIGLVHFISYSTEVFFTHHEAYACRQFYWLVDDLTKANTNRHNVPWVVAMGHRPMYCSNDNGDDCTNLPFRGRVRAGLEKMFHAQGVDLIIEAHEHSYERSWPVFDHDVIQTNYVNPKGSVHVITGAAGNKEGKDQMVPYLKAWSAYRHATPHENNFGRLHAMNQTHLFWEQVGVENTTVFDSFWLVQHAHGPFVQGLNCSVSASNRHSSCTCPPPFYTWIIIYVLCLIVGLVVTAVVSKVLLKRRRRMRGSRCCKSRREAVSMCCDHDTVSDPRVIRKVYVKDFRDVDDLEALLPEDGK